MTFRTHHCRQCKGPTRQRYSHSEGNHGRPVQIWACTVCKMSFLTMNGSNDVPDADGLCINALERATRKFAVRPSREWEEEAFLELRWAIIVLWRKWDPSRSKCKDFRAFAFTMLHNAIINWERANKGRDTPKPLSIADSLDRPVRAGDDRTVGDNLTANEHALEAADLQINVRTLRPQHRDYYEHIETPMRNEGLTIDQMAARLGWHPAELKRERTSFEKAIRAQFPNVEARRAELRAAVVAYAHAHPEASSYAIAKAVPYRRDSVRVALAAAIAAGELPAALLLWEPEPSKRRPAAARALVAA